MGKFSFTKEERLSKEKWIKELFEKGSSFNLYPFRILFYRHPDPAWPVHQVLISVAIRNFKKAADRNLLRRRTREAFRRHKGLLSADPKFVIAYIYTGREKEPYEKIEATLLKTLDSIAGGKVLRKPGKNLPANEPG